MGRIQEMVDREPELSRRELSRRVCDWLNWRTLKGEPKAVNCRVALLKLQQCGQIRLASASPFPAERKRPKGKTRGAGVERAEVRRRLGQVQPVELVRVGSADSEASRTWNGLMEQHHPLGGGPLCGAQLRYLIYSADGYLGGLAFSAAAWRLQARDSWIGWKEAARRQNLQRVIANSRFLILPGYNQ